MKSNIRINVQFKDSAIYSGEDLACIITFRNVAATAVSDADSYQHDQTPIAHHRLIPRPASLSTGRARPSLGSLASPSETSTAPVTGAGIGTGSGPGRRQSTLSVSVGPNVLAHARTRSIASPKSPHHPPVVTTPLYESRHGRSLSASSLNSTVLSPITPSGHPSRRASRIWQSGYREPASPRAAPGTGTGTGASPSPSKSKHGDTPSAASPRSSHQRTHSQGSTHGLASHDPNGPSPRSSTDILARSRHSQETLVSEPNLAPLRPFPFRKASSQSYFNNTPEPSLPTVLEPEHLMMAHVQTLGSFTVDGSLVDQGPFESVKLQNVMAGSGAGGVVGIESQKAHSSFFGAFAWSSLGDSLGGVLGKDEKSSIKDTRASAATKTVPLLSTPQSLLFVDLRLAPGEEKSCAYTFRMPQGLPPSHRGRAIKVQYHLKLGVQRPGELNGRKQTSTADVPFRVLGSLNERGETLGHDLMSPHILRQDKSKTADLDSDPSSLRYLSSKPVETSMTTHEEGLVDFLAYNDRLLYGRTPNEALTSPSESRKHSFQLPHPGSHLNMQERIDYAISRSNQAGTAQSPLYDESMSSRATNKFIIVKDDRYIGTLSLLRPAYRLGETVIGTIQFATSNNGPADSGSGTGIVNGPAPQRTYVVTTSLETVETVDDPSLALRSNSSIERATKKVVATNTCPAHFAVQTGFALEIPSSATPGFETSCVSLHWRLHVSFSTEVVEEEMGDDGNGEEDDAGRGPRGFRVGGRSRNEYEHVNQTRDDEQVQNRDRDRDRDQIQGQDGGSADEQQIDRDRARHDDRDETETEGQPQLRPRPQSQPQSQAGTRPVQTEHGAGSEKLMMALRRDRNDTILVARDTLETDCFETTIPLRVYGHVISRPIVSVSTPASEPGNANASGTGPGTGNGTGKGSTQQTYVHVSSHAGFRAQEVAI